MSDRTGKLSEEELEALRDGIGDNESPESNIARLLATLDAECMRRVEAEQKVRELLYRWMPIQDTPFAILMLALDEQTAQRNSDQSLSRLRERGGISICEAAALVERRQWRSARWRESVDAILRAERA